MEITKTDKGPADKPLHRNGSKRTKRPDCKLDIEATQVNQISIWHENTEAKRFRTDANDVKDFGGIGVSLNVSHTVNNDRGLPGNDADKAVGADYDETELHPMLVEKSLKHKDDATDTDTDDDNNKEHNDKRHFPVDRDWAWMILLGATLEMALTIGMIKTSGIFFVNFQQRFDSTSSITSLLSTVQNGVYSVGVLFVTTIGMKFMSGRLLNMVGGTIICVGYIISSRAADIRLLLLSHGVLQGIGIACMQPVAVTMVGTYFDKRRGFANSIAVSGSSLGGLIFAPLLTTLFETYGYAGAMLITSSFFLHGWVTGALFRPTSFYKKRRNDLQYSRDNVHTTTDSSMGRNTENSRTQLLKKQDSIHLPCLPTSLVAVNESWTNRMRAETYSEGDMRIHYQYCQEGLKSQTEKSHLGSSLSLIINKIAESNVGIYASSEYVTGPQFDIPVANEAGNKTILMTPKPKSIFKSLSKLFDFSLFKNPVFIVFIIAAGLLNASNLLTPVFLAPHAKEIGISASGVATFLTIYSAMDLCSRIIVGIIADKGWLRRSTIIGISACILGVTAQFLRFYNSYEWIIFYAVIVGLLSGVHLSLFAVVIVDYLTLAKLRSGLGFTSLCHGACVSVTYAVIGLLRDNSGSYLIPFHMKGTMALIGGMMMISLPAVERFHNMNKKVPEPHRMTHY